VSILRLTHFAAFGRAAPRRSEWEPSAACILNQSVLYWIKTGRRRQMKIATYRIAGERRVGVVDERRKTVSAFGIPVAEAEWGLLGLIERDPLPSCLSPTPFGEVEFEAPIPRPRRNVFCIGKNYHEHAREFASSGFDSSAAAGVAPKFPIVFSKVPESVVGHRDIVRIDPAVSEAVDYEAELGVIIGKGGRGITASNALDHVWGYTIINDVTARDLQGRHSQWLIGKSQDTFCPMGPWAVTKDEIDLADTQIRCWVNGELRQNANTRDLIFDVPTIIATISAGVTLRPGDVIATGTPAGVGIGFSPPKYLVPGDVARIEVERIGVLENEFRELRA
jgi:2-keto-4-pentenoate hydratase/2-oxohepta-3-ene-1,7-dioic acid hydratase in catechol pathway